MKTHIIIGLSRIKVNFEEMKIRAELAMKRLPDFCALDKFRLFIFLSVVTVINVIICYSIVGYPIVWTYSQQRNSRQILDGNGTLVKVDILKKYQSDV